MSKKINKSKSPVSSSKQKRKFIINCTQIKKLNEFLEIINFGRYTIENLYENTNVLSVKAKKKFSIFFKAEFYFLKSQDRFMK